MRCELILIFFVAFLLTFYQTNAASCNSNEYCPLAWAIKRKTDGSVLTCEPHNPNKKCPKPYMCIASKCGINFCCANEKMLEHVHNMEEAEAENKEDDEL